MSASSAGAIRQGRAFVELFTDDTKLKQGLRLAENSVRKFGASVSHIGARMMAAGAAILAPLGLAVREYAKAGGALKEMSDRTGVAVESLSELKYVASQTGASMQDLEKGIRLSQKVLGSSTGATALAKLGIDAAKLKALSPEDQFMALAEYIGKIPDQADRAAAAMQLFGRGGAALLPMLNEGREGISRLREEARRLGQTMSTADAIAADKLDDSLSRVQQQVLRLVGSIGGSLAPELERFGKWFSTAIPRIRAFVDEHRGWIVAAARAALYAVGLGLAMMTLGKAIIGVSLAINIVRTVIVPLIGFLISWPGIILAAVAAVIYFIGGFKELGRVFKQVWGGISDAISAGDIKLAMQILWAGVVLIWTEGCNNVFDFFSSLWVGLRKILVYAGGGIMVAIMTLVQGIHWLWTELWTRVANGWTEMWSRLKTSIIAAKNWLGIMSDEEAAAAIKTEIEVRTKTIAERQDTRAAAHAEDAARVDDVVAEMGDELDALDAWNLKNIEAHDASTERKKQELADLIAKAKAEKEAMKVNPEATPGGGAAPKKPDIGGGGGGAQDRANAVAGGFDIGALLSFQAGASDSKLDKIADASERTADAVEALSESGLEGSYGG